MTRRSPNLTTDVQRETLRLNSRRQTTPHASQLTAGLHPDDNLVAAYIEGTTTPSEDRAVMHHLRNCAECFDLTTTVAAQTAITGGRIAPDLVDLRRRPSTLALAGRSLWAFMWGALAAAAAYGLYLLAYAAW